MSCTELEEELGQLLGSQDLQAQLTELLSLHCRGAGVEAVFGWMSATMPKEYKQKLETTKESLFTLELASAKTQKRAFKNAVRHAVTKELGTSIYSRKIPAGWNEDEEFTNFVRAWGTSPCELFLSDRLGIMGGIIQPICDKIKTLIKAEDLARINPVEVTIHKLLLI